jgi:superfamily II DNA or RNA helicase
LSSVHTPDRHVIIRNLARIPCRDKAEFYEVLNQYRYTDSSTAELTSLAFYDVKHLIVCAPIANREKLSRILQEHGFSATREVPEYSALNWNIRQEFNLFPEQEPVCREFIEYIKRNNFGVLSAPCGCGKTIMLTWCTACLNTGPLLILVDQTNLLRQWQEAAYIVTGEELQELSALDLEKQDPAQMPKALVGTFQYAYRQRELLQKYRDSFGTIIVDEVHTIKAKTYKAVRGIFNPRYAMGCSATYFLKSLPTEALIDLAGPIGATMQVPERVKPEVLMLTTNYRMGANPDFTSQYLTQMSEDEERNNLILEVVKILHNQGRRILLIVPRKEQAGILRTQLEEAHNIKALNYVGSSTVKRDAEVKRMVTIAEVRVVIASKKMDKGVDIPALDTLIQAYPVNNRTAVQQRTGRIERIFPDKRQPLVVDMVDRGAMAKRWGANRYVIYTDLGLDAPLFAQADDLSILDNFAS